MYTIFTGDGAGVCMRIFPSIFFFFWYSGKYLVLCTYLSGPIVRRFIEYTGKGGGIPEKIGTKRETTKAGMAESGGGKSITEPRDRRARRKSDENRRLIIITMERRRHEGVSSRHCVAACGRCKRFFIFFSCRNITGKGRKKVRIYTYKYETDARIRIETGQDVSSGGRTTGNAAKVLRILARDALACAWPIHNIIRAWKRDHDGKRAKTPRVFFDLFVYKDTHDCHRHTIITPPPPRGRERYTDPVHTPYTRICSYT